MSTRTFKKHARGTQWCPGSGTRVIGEILAVNGVVTTCPICGRAVETKGTTTPLVVGPVPENFARLVLDSQKFADGGGWCRVDGKDIYLCSGAHKDGTSGWAIKQVGRSF